MAQDRLVAHRQHPPASVKQFSFFARTFLWKDNVNILQLHSLLFMTIINRSIRYTTIHSLFEV